MRGVVAFFIGPAKIGGLTSYRDGVILEYGPMKWILKGGWRGAFETCEKWVIVEAAAEGVFQLWRVLRRSKLAACLCSFPGGESARARRASARAVAKLYAMMVLVPGSAAPLLYAAAEHLSRRRGRTGWSPSWRTRSWGPGRRSRPS